MKNEIKIFNKELFIHFEPKRLYLKKIKHRDKTLLLKSGIELGDWFNYFSQEEKVSALKGEIIELIRNDLALKSVWKIKLNKGTVYFDDNFSLKSSKLRRKTTFKIEKGCYIGDIVQRWVIRASEVWVNNKKIYDNSNGIYNEEIFKKRKKNKINFITNNHNIQIILERKISDPRDICYLPYIKRIPRTNVWILHNRYKCIEGDQYFIKGCINWYNKPFPKFFSNSILKFSEIKKLLLYIRERKIPSFPFQAVCNKYVSEDRTYELISQIKIDKSDF
jgi:hypothetical protein